MNRWWWWWCVCIYACLRASSCNCHLWALKTLLYHNWLDEDFQKSISTFLLHFFLNELNISQYFCNNFTNSSFSWIGSFLCTARWASVFVCLFLNKIINIEQAYKHSRYHTVRCKRTTGRCTSSRQKYCCFRREYSPRFVLQRLKCSRTEN